MDKTNAKRALLVMTAVIIMGALPACTPTNNAVQPENFIYGQSASPQGAGPGTACNRNPPPSQC